MSLHLGPDLARPTPPHPEGGRVIAFVGVQAGGFAPHHSLMRLAVHATQDGQTLAEQVWAVAHSEYVVDAAVLRQQGLGDLGAHHQQATALQRVREEFRLLWRRLALHTADGWVPPHLGGQQLALFTLPPLRAAGLINHHDPAQCAGLCDTAKLASDLTALGLLRGSRSAAGLVADLMALPGAPALPDALRPGGDEEPTGPRAGPEAGLVRDALHEARLQAWTWHAGVRWLAGHQDRMVELP